MTLFRAKANHNNNNSNGKKNNSRKHIIRTCCTGEVFDISLVSNDAISSKILGEGFVVACADKDIVAPADGILCDISDNGHTYAIDMEDGVSLLVCITADSKDEIIEPAVEVGQMLSAGDVICSKENAEAAVIVTNSEIMSSCKIAVGKAKSVNDGVIAYEL